MSLGCIGGRSIGKSGDNISITPVPTIKPAVNASGVPTVTPVIIPTIDPQQTSGNSPAGWSYIDPSIAEIIGSDETEYYPEIGLPTPSAE